MPAQANIDILANAAQSIQVYDVDGKYVAGDGDSEPDAADDTPGTRQMEAQDSNTRIANLPNEGGRSGSPGEPSGTGRQEHLLHIPAEGGSVRRATESTVVWDWDTPLEAVGESSSYYYEPQGELLQERLPPQRPGKDEFSIPQPLPSNSGHRSYSTTTLPRAPQSIPPSVVGSKRKSTSDRESVGAGRHPDPKRFSRGLMAGTAEDGGSSVEDRQSLPRTRSQDDPAESTQPQESEQAEDDGQQRTLENPSITLVLPPRKVFPIQIGDKLFRLSGASISSDAPSYFSQFFEEQLRQSEGADSVRTLYIDRDPSTFEDIALHLQGYHVEPRDGTHFVKLFADAQFFSLPRLTAQLFSSTIYIRIGDEQFQIPRDLFSNPGDSPNYFSLGFSIFFTTPTEVFPGLSQRTLLRPPSILPPCIPNRSAKTFADLLHILKGYPVEIRSEEHRAELLRDARYFHLKGLEQRLIPHSISYNLARKRNEIVVRLEDIRQSGISFVADNAGQPSDEASPASNKGSNTPTGPGWIHYQRPYVDSEAYTLIVEITGSESTYLSLAPGSASSPARVGRAMFHRQTLSRITSLFSVIANKMNLPITQPLGLMMMERGAGVASLPVSPGNTGVSEERVKVRVGPDADVVVDGKTWIVGGDEDEDDDESGMDIDRSESSRAAGRKRKRNDGEDEGEDWVLTKAQWRLRVQPLSGGVQAGRSGMEVILGAVKIEAYSNERARNAARGFLV